MERVSIDLNTVTSKIAGIAHLPLEQHVAEYEEVQRLLNQKLTELENL
jgi:hypothetical protein